MQFCYIKKLNRAAILGQKINRVAWQQFASTPTIATAGRPSVSRQSSSPNRSRLQMQSTRQTQAVGTDFVDFEIEHWIKDLRFGTSIKDEEGHLGFALVNKATGQAIQHSLGPHEQVRLVPYDPRFPDESVLWSESKDLGDGFHCIRKVNDITLNFDAFHGDKDHGGVRDGTVVGLYEWFKKSMNQLWKILCYGGIVPNVNELQLTRSPTVRIYTKAALDYSVTVRNGDVVLAPANPLDDHQHWIKDFRFSKIVKDEEGFPGFALINKATGQAVKHSLGKDRPVRLVPYKPDYIDESILWAESNNVGDGFRCIRMVNNIRFNFDAYRGNDECDGVHDGTPVILFEWLHGKNQVWKIDPYY